jgi:hypothetical protein
MVLRGYKLNKRVFCVAFLLRRHFLENNVLTMF